LKEQEQLQTNGQEKPDDKVSKRLSKHHRKFMTSSRRRQYFQTVSKR
jgi:hypothetical protein